MKVLLPIFMSIEDPVAFVKPMVMRLTYTRFKDLDRVIYLDCTENDRNLIVNGELTIAPPNRRPAVEVHCRNVHSAFLQCRHMKQRRCFRC